MRAALPVVLLLLLLAACGQSRTSPDANTFLRDQLAQLDTLPLPAGADGATWDQLKSALAVMLHQKLAGKTTLLAPKGDASASVLALDNGTLELSWDYASQGDYDQNRETNIADLSALAVHFGQNTGGAGPFPRDSVQGVVDGDSNGEINISDLGPIGANFGRRVLGYKILASHDIADLPATNDGPDGPGAEDRGTVDFTDGTGNPFANRLQFSFALPAVQTSWFYWVRPVDGASEGTPSNVVSFGGAAGNLPPVAALTADPLIGDRPLTVNFDAGGSSDPDGTAGDISDIVSFQWDFEGDGTVDQTTSTPTTTFVYNQQGSFDATVTVFDAGAASAQATQQITVNDSTNVPPNAQLTATPTTGTAPLSVKFDFSGSADTDGTVIDFLLDLDGDGTTDFDSADSNGGPTVVYSQGGVFNVKLIAKDNRGATDEEVVDLNISGGFTPSVVAETGDVDVRDIALAPFNATDPNDSRIFVGFSTSDHTMKFLRSTNEAGTAWDATPTDTNSFASDLANEALHLGVVQGKPAFAYVSNTFDSINYLRALNATGSAWPNNPLTIDSNAGARSPSLRLVDGNPAVAYFRHSNQTGDIIDYARCDAADGAGFWSVVGAQVLTTSSLVPKKVQLVFSNNTPAVLYLEGTTMRGEKADNDLGSDWDGDGDSAVNGETIGYSILTESGDEAVGCIVNKDVTQSPTARRLFAVHETNSFGHGFGSFWNVFGAIDSSKDIDNNVEFRRRNSKGIVVYRDRASRELRFAISTSSTGETYTTPQTLAFAQNVDVFDVAVLNGHVVVVYYDKLDKRIEAVSGL